MKKNIICGAITVALLAALVQVLPDIKRYLRISRM
ncbi:DUF6893 family small protein [Streptomyces sp. SP18CS02]